MVNNFLRQVGSNSVASSTNNTTDSRNGHLHTNIPQEGRHENQEQSQPKRQESGIHQRRTTRRPPTNFLAPIGEEQPADHTTVKTNPSLTICNVSALISEEKRIDHVPTCPT